mgnify:CR=1 FL=1
MSEIERLRVLVADDEEGMRLGVRRALGKARAAVAETQRELAFDVSEAATGDAALALIRDEAPDIVLLDHSMPELTGMEILDQLSLFAQLGVVSLTA